jgi:hypothetical protein
VLELLAGPYSRLLSDGSAPPDVSAMFWDDRLGIANWSRTGGSSYAITQLDGSAFTRAAAPTTMSHFILNQSTADWIFADQFQRSVYYFDSNAGVIGDSLGFYGPVSSLADARILCSDRWLAAYKYSDGTFKVRSKALDLSGSWVDEAVITGATGTNGVSSVSKTSKNDEFYFTSIGGFSVKYNVTTKQFDASTVSFMPTNKFCWYSPKLNVFVLVDANSKIQIYAATPKPNTISNPAAVGSFLRGQINTVRVRLLGSNNEPCPNELVNWMLTSGSGNLLTAQSTTDSSGYASAKYLAPLTGGSAPVIQAEVRF